MIRCMMNTEFPTEVQNREAVRRSGAIALDCSGRAAMMPPPEQGLAPCGRFPFSRLSTIRIISTRHRFPYLVMGSTGGVIASAADFTSICSFSPGCRVVPGAKERGVQVDGPTQSRSGGRVFGGGIGDGGLGIRMPQRTE
jgi:hypothetical protein